MDAPKRLDKFLRESTNASLADLRAECLAGRVVIVESGQAAGRCETDPGALVYPGEQVLLDGIVLTPREHHDYLMLHKPVGVTTTVSDPDEQQDLSNWLSKMPSGVFPVGRLDRMTSGLLLITNDGDFAHAMLSPVHKVSKRYELMLHGEVECTDTRVLALAHGVVVPGCKRPLVARVERMLHRGRHTELTIRIKEGKHRQIRKMCRAVGLHLGALHRSAIGPLELADLAQGAFRHLSASEVQSLWELAGGLGLVQRRQCVALRQRASLQRARGEPMMKLERWLERFGPEL